MTCIKRVNKSSETFFKKGFRHSKGNLFHTKGANILKARHPYVLH